MLGASMLTFCTIAAASRLAAARVLAEDLRRHHPEARLVLLVLDRPPAEIEGPFTVIGPDEIGGGAVRPELGAGGFELEAAALRPALIAALLAEGGPVVYLAPETRVLDTLAPLLELAGRHGIALTRRVRALPDDGELPGWAELLAAGRIAEAPIAVADSARGTELTEWWSQRLAEGEDPAQPWLDIAADVFESVAVCEELGIGASFWNLHERPLSRDGTRWLAAGQPLRLMALPGFRPDHPYVLAPEATRVRVVEDPLLAELCGEHAERLRAAGWTAPESDVARLGVLGNGIRADHLVSALWQRARREGLDFGDPSAPADADAFTAWLRGPAERGGTRGISRYLFAAYQTRPDLQRAFPDLDGPDADGLLEWAHAHGPVELVADLVPGFESGFAPGSGNRVAVQVIGYLRDTLGLGEAARHYVSALQAAGVPVSTMAVAPDLPVDGVPVVSRAGAQAFEDIAPGVEPAFNLACVNGDHLEMFVRATPEFLHGRPTIGQWGWETDVLPPSWLGAYRHLEEIWVYSRFVAENLGRLAPIPVVVVPPPVTVPDVTGVDPGIEFDGRFTFLFMLDLFSTLQRKNPLGLVEAFAREFSAGEGPRLLIKTINAQYRPEAYDALRWAAGDRPDIEIVDRMLSSVQKAALVARADCYVSLHRSEGFGLPLAEAMLLGTPVIATGYSGNTDFMTPSNSHLVDWRLARVGPECEVYPPEGTWAEPELGHAGALMRRVFGRPEEAKAMAERAQRDVALAYAPEASGRIARARLERLAERLAQGEQTGSAAQVAGAGELAAAEQLLAMDLTRGADSSRGGASALVRRLTLRLMLPYTFHERRLDRVLVDALRGVRAELEVERAGRVGDRRRIAALEAALAAEAARRSEPR